MVVMVPVVMMPAMPVVVMPAVVMMPANLFGLEAIDLVLRNDGGLR